MTDQKGFTLLEILVSVSILAIVLVTLFSSYTGSLRLMEEAEYRADIHKKARVSLGRITEDLESACIFRDDNATGQFFKGTRGEVNDRKTVTLSFSSSAYPVFSLEGEDTGETTITYYLMKEGKGDTFGLYRGDRPWFEPATHEEDSGFLLCDGLISMDYIYYDASGGAHYSWDSTVEQFMNSPPARVSVSLEFANDLRPEFPFRFMTGVTIPATGADHEKSP